MVGQNDALALPDALSFEEGAAIPVVYGTAYAAVVRLGNVQRGEWILIHAVAGGVGIAATQFAHRLGARIFGTASKSKHAAVQAQGVERVIDYHTENVSRRDSQDHGRARARCHSRRARRAPFQGELRPPAPRGPPGDVRGELDRHRRASKPVLRAEDAHRHAALWLHEPHGTEQIGASGSTCFGCGTIADPSKRSRGHSRSSSATATSSRLSEESSRWSRRPKPIGSFRNARTSVKSSCVFHERRAYCCGSPIAT